MNNIHHWIDDADNTTILVENDAHEVLASFSYQWIDRIMAIKLAEQKIEQLNSGLLTITKT